MTMIGETCRVRLELRAGFMATIPEAERPAVLAWLRDCERVLQHEADRMEVRTLPDGSVASIIRKPDGQ